MIKTGLIALGALALALPAVPEARAADACPHFQALGQNCRARWQSLGGGSDGQAGAFKKCMEMYSNAAVAAGCGGGTASAGSAPRSSRADGGIPGTSVGRSGVDGGHPATSVGRSTADGGHAGTSVQRSAIDGGTVQRAPSDDDASGSGSGSDAAAVAGFALDILGAAASGYAAGSHLGGGSGGTVYRRPSGGSAPSGYQGYHPSDISGTH